MPNLAQQAAINVGSLPSDIEALNQVTKYHDDTVARQRELTQLSRGQIDLARASDDLHSGRLEAQRRIDEEEAWKNDQQSIIENMANLDYTSDDYQEQLAIQISSLSETALKSPAVQLMTKAGLERSAGYKSQQATGRELNRIQGVEAGLDSNQLQKVNLSGSAEEGRAIIENSELDNADGDNSLLFNSGVIDHDQYERNKLYLTDPEVLSMDKSTSLALARNMRSLVKNHQANVERIRASDASAAEKDAEFRVQNAKTALVSSDAHLKTITAMAESVQKTFKEAYHDKGKEIPSKGDAGYNDYLNSQAAVKRSQDAMDEAIKAQQLAQNNFSVISGSLHKVSKPTVSPEDVGQIESKRPQGSRPANF